MVSDAQYWSSVAALLTPLALFIAGVFWFIRRLEREQQAARLKHNRDA